MVEPAAPAREQAEDRARDQTDISRVDECAAGDADVEHLDLTRVGLARMNPQTGLGRVKCDGAVACTAAPATTPVEASTPDGTSTLMTGAGQASIACDRLSDRAAGLAREARAEQGVDDDARPRERIPAASRAPAGASPGSRSRFARASPVSFAGDPTHTTVTSRPASRSRRATTSPSPPLLPIPHTTATGPSGANRSTARATPAPARSIRSSDGTPRSSIAQRSIARMRSASGRGVSQSGSASTTERC